MPDAAKRAAAQRRYQLSEKGIAARRRYDRKRGTRPEHNAERIFMGSTYLGTTNQFPVDREAVIDFARSLRKEHVWHA